MKRALTLLVLLSGCGVVEVSPAACNIDGVAYRDGDVDPAVPGAPPWGVGAWYCDPSNARDAWTCYPGVEATAPAGCQPVSQR
jgi:hypothetical protein